jgi:hypothetical protein
MEVPSLQDPPGLLVPGAGNSIPDLSTVMLEVINKAPPHNRRSRLVRPPKGRSRPPCPARVLISPLT